MLVSHGTKLVVVGLMRVKRDVDTAEYNLRVCETVVM